MYWPLSLTPRTFAALSEFRTWHQGHIEWPVYKLIYKEDSVVALCEQSEFMELRHMIMDKIHKGEKKNSRHNETFLREFHPVATYDFIYEAGRT